MFCLISCFFSSLDEKFWEAANCWICRKEWTGKLANYHRYSECCGTSTVLAGCFESGYALGLHSICSWIRRTGFGCRSKTNPNETKSKVRRQIQYFNIKTTCNSKL
jgi:hypothetical protein